MCVRGQSVSQRCGRGDHGHLFQLRIIPSQMSLNISNHRCIFRHTLAHTRNVSELNIGTSFSIFPDYFLLKLLSLRLFPYPHLTIDRTVPARPALSARPGASQRSLAGRRGSLSASAGRCARVAQSRSERRTEHRRLRDIARCVRASAVLRVWTAGHGQDVDVDRGHFSGK